MAVKHQWSPNSYISHTEMKLSYDYRNSSVEELYLALLNKAVCPLVIILIGHDLVLWFIFNVCISQTAVTVSQINIGSIYLLLNRKLIDSHQNLFIHFARQNLLMCFKRQGMFCIWMSNGLYIYCQSLFNFFLNSGGNCNESKLKRCGLDQVWLTTFQTFTFKFIVLK